ncbi:hypothetical protein ACKKBF_B39355 [Auxenochlorella protothecoides x Auxenochlorella symbiontica]
MFSKSQLAKMAGKCRITQETFDEAVRENIVEFDMEAEEALKSAIAEFEDQNVDLSNIIKSVSGGNTSGHPAAECLATVKTASGAEFVQACHHLVLLLEDPEGEASNILLQRGAVGALLSVLEAGGGAADAEGASAGLRVLKALFGTRSHQTACLEATGPPILQAIVARPESTLGVKALGLEAATALARKHEAGKVALLVAGMASAALPVLESVGRATGEDEEEGLAACCSLLSALTCADDDTLPSSSAFANARSLGKGALPVLVRTLSLREGVPTSPSTLVALCSAIKQLSANEELCGVAAEHGALGILLRHFSAASKAGEESVMRAACAALRQLCSSDSCKAAFLDQDDVIPRLASALKRYNTRPLITEQVLGLMTNLALRNPAASLALVGERGCLDAVLRALTAAAMERTADPRAASAMRQGCMAIRNMAVRCEEAKTELLALHAQDVLYSIRDSSAPGALQDAASAALRDLGMLDYLPKAR